MWPVQIIAGVLIPSSPVYAATGRAGRSCPSSHGGVRQVSNKDDLTMLDGPPEPILPQLLLAPGARLRGRLAGARWAGRPSNAGPGVDPPRLRPQAPRAQAPRRLSGNAGAAGVLQGPRALRSAASGAAAATTTARVRAASGRSGSRVGRR